MAVVVRADPHPFDVADTQISTLGPTGTMVAENIRRLRAMRVMTYVALSRRLAVIGRPIPVLGLRRIEQGERRVDADDLVALAEVLGVEPVQLLAAPACNACYGAPAYGFTCNECGASAGEQR